MFLAFAVSLASGSLHAYEQELLALLAGTTTSTTTTTPALDYCTAGRFRAHGSACEACPAGKFQRLANARECVSCPMGKFQLHTAQNQCAINHCAASTVPSWAGCVQCKIGQFAAVGAAACTSCDIAEGQYSFSAGGSACEQSECAMGWRQTRAGCVECHEGEFQGKVGQAWCLKCPDGFVSPRGSSTCYPNEHPDRVLAKHSPGVTKECSHITCQWNGMHIRVTHDGRERHGGSHHCKYTGAKYYANAQAHGECVCMCKVPNPAKHAAACIIALVSQN